jgi:hypothetical protein
MPLNAAEVTETAIAMLRCFGEDSTNLGRTLRFLTDFTAGKVNLLSAVQTQALTWQPFLDSGLSIPAWNTELARIYNLTQTA